VSTADWDAPLTVEGVKPQTDTFRCPAGRTLVRKQVLTRKLALRPATA
jgi:hypothetical protein